MSGGREHRPGQDREGGQELDDARGGDSERARMMLMHRRHRQRRAAQRNEQPMNEAEKAQAGQFKEAMKRKIEGVSTTVAQASELFQSALLREKLGDKPHKATDRLVDVVINVLVSQLGTALKNFVGGGAIGGIVKQAISVVKSAAKGAHGPGGELETIDNIVSTAKTAADRFVEVFQNLVDAMPVEQASADMKLLNVTKQSPAVEEAAEADSPEAGNVTRGVENQFLEAAGAPVTGPAEAEALATAMLREYKAERISYFDTPSGSAGAVKEALADKAPGEIGDAEKRTGLDKDVQADKTERERASAVGNGDM